MAAPVANKIILPVDTGNTGKNVRTQTRVVGSDTVHEHFHIPISRREIKGIYGFSATAPAAVQAAAQNGTTTGFFWLEMPVGATKRGRLRRFSVMFDWGAVPTVDILTLPRIALARFTFTGAASGAQITPAKRNPGDDANVATIRTASTGMTVTLGAIFQATFAPFIDFATAAGINVQPHEVTELIPAGLFEDEWPDYGPGEGLVLYQPDAGTASDPRRFNFRGVCDEYDNS